LRRIADYERVSCWLWLVLGILQLVSVVAALAGIWNILAAKSRWNLPDRIRQRDETVPEDYEGLGQLIVLGIVNLLFGAAVGVVFVIFDFVIRDQVLKNRHLFSGDSEDAGERDRSPEPRSATRRKSNVVETVVAYEAAFREVRTTMERMGGAIKQEDSTEGKIEASYKHGINAFGLRVTAVFRELENGSLQVSFTGGFKDAIDTWGSAKKKAMEVRDEFAARIETVPPQQSLDAIFGPQHVRPSEARSYGSSAPRAKAGEAPHRGKSKGLAALLAFLLGGLGIHKFYLGCWGWGVLYVLFSWTYIPLLVSVVECIALLIRSQDGFDRKYNYSAPSPFTW